MLNSNFSDEYGFFTISQARSSLPRFSILMAVKSHLDFLKIAIDSILNQEFKDWELVVVSDGADTDIVDYLSQLVMDNEQVCLINQENIGLTKSLNRAILFCRGEYIVRHDADDISVPHRLQTLAHVIAANRCEVSFSRATVFGEGVKEKIVPKNVMLGGFFLNALRFGNFFVHGSICVKKDVFIKHQYDSSLKYTQDYDLFIRLLKLHLRICYIREPLYLLRESTTSISASLSSQQISFAQLICRRHFGSDFLLVAAAKNSTRLALQILRQLCYLLGHFNPIKRIKVV